LQLSQWCFLFLFTAPHLRHFLYIMYLLGFVLASKTFGSTFASFSNKLSDFSVEASLGILLYVVCFNVERPLVDEFFDLFVELSFFLFFNPLSERSDFGNEAPVCFVEAI